jgi:hypothetical protein
MSTPATNNSSSSAATPSTSAAASTSSTQLPSNQTLLQAAKLAIEQDRAIMLDYYVQTTNGTAFLGEDPDTSLQEAYDSL